MRFRKNSRALLLTAILLAQIALVHGFSRRETPPSNPPLSQVPATVGPWSLAQEGVVEQDVRDVLKADDLLSRLYADTRNGQTASLFMAYFRSQRTGAAPHSPKNCLPGSGWIPSDSRILSVSVPGKARPMPVNYYLVSKGEVQSVVLYWYHGPGRVVASEYAAKVHMVTDAIRYNRTDAALVRVIVPVGGRDPEAALGTARRFVADFFPALRSFVPR